MTKNEYMKELAHRLKRLPKEDFDAAMEYFEEYFSEAGAENEALAIQNLGSPKSAANELILSLASEKSQKAPKTVKGGVSALWVIILAIFAAPIALPISIAVAAVLVALFICFATLVLCFFLLAAAAVLGGLFGIAGGVGLLSKTVADGLVNIGIGAMFIGAGILLCYLGVVFFRWTIKKFLKMPGKLKGGKPHEKN